MTKEQRLYIIREVCKLYGNTASLFQMVDYFVLEELQYATIKVRRENLPIQQEFKKIIELYTFDGYMPSKRVLSFYKQACNDIVVASMGHVELNDCVSYIGEYYDGEPTIKYRKKGRYEIKPIVCKEQE